MILTKQTRLILTLLMSLGALLPACRRTSTRVSAPAQESVSPSTEAPATTRSRPAPAPVEAPKKDDEILHEPGWVQVEVLRANVEGAWVTGDFDEARNKIEIETRGVKQFSVDLSQIRVNWDRLVILGIDGRNAELRHRDTDLLHIARDESGAWVVLEP